MSTPGAIQLDVHLTESDADTALRSDVTRGLAASPKELPPKWFYDARGSELFERITELPEYYPFRTERALLTDSVDDIARASGADTVVELGSGSSTKTRLLLDAFARAGTLRRYVPQDVSESALRGAIDELHRDYPELELHGVVGDFTRDLDRLPGAEPGGKRMIAFLGGTIGNLMPGPRHEFPRHVRSVLRPGAAAARHRPGHRPGRDGPRLRRRRRGHRGVQSQRAARAQPGARRDLRRRRVRPRRGVGRGELVDRDAVARHPRHAGPDRRPRPRRRVRRGEELATEISAKFTPATVDAFAAAAGFATTRRWVDPDARFALTLFTADGVVPVSRRTAATNAEGVA